MYLTQNLLGTMFEKCCQILWAIRCQILWVMKPKQPLKQWSVIVSGSKHISKKAIYKIRRFFILLLYAEPFDD